MFPRLFLVSCGSPITRVPENQGFPCLRVAAMPSVRLSVISRRPPIVNTGNPGFPEPWLSEIRRRTVNNPRICLIFQVFFWVFQAEDFGKLSAPAFRIFLDRLRALEIRIRPISSNFSDIFQLFDPNKYENPTFPLYSICIDKIILRL